MNLADTADACTATDWTAVVLFGAMVVMLGYCLYLLSRRL